MPDILLDGNILGLPVGFVFQLQKCRKSSSVWRQFFFLEDYCKSTFIQTELTCLSWIHAWLGVLSSVVDAIVRIIVLTTGINKADI